MPQCPQCQQNVPYSALLRAGGLAGIVCPRCNTELEPVMWIYATAAVIALLASAGAASVLRLVGLPTGWRLLVQVAAFVVLLTLAWATVIRLRPRKDRSRPLGPF